MQIQLSFLQSKVARRIFALFVLSALIPILLTSYLAYNQVRSLIETDRMNQLNRESKLLSTVTYERFLNIAYRINNLPINVEQNNYSDNNSVFSDFAISSAIFEPDSMTTYQLYGTTTIENLNALFPDDTQNNTLYVRSEKVTGKISAIYLLKALLDSTGSLRYLIVTINPDYLWPQEYISYGMYGIVYNAEGDLLYQDKRLPTNFSSKALSGMIRDGKPASILKAGQETYYVAAKNLFMEGDFHTSDWVFVSVQPKAISLLDLRKFASYFIPPILLSICLISIVSLIAIRRTLVPIDKLLEGTRKISEKKFTHKIDLQGNDEFSALASSFNQMTVRLKTQFEIYDNLSNIDQLILHSAPAQNIIETVLSGFNHLARPDYVFLILLENNVCQLFSVHADDGSITAQAVDEPFENLLEMNEEAEYKRGEETEGGIGWLNLLNTQSEGASCIFDIFKLSIDEQIFGAVVLANNAKNSYNEEQYSIFRDYASRIAIAIAALRTREQLELFATVDSLTNVPNRRQMKLLADRAVSKIAETGGVGAFLFIDLDHFKNINDAHGHQKGDQLLVAVAKRLTSCVQKGYTAARLGGDEFAILIPSAENLEDVNVFARYIIENLSRRYVIEDVVMYVGASIGIALFPEHGGDSDELLQNADIALYKAKNHGRGKAFIFSNTMGEERLKRTQLETDIREALKNNEFELYYQPKVDLKTGMIKGFEVLLRWFHKAQGFIPPLKIISIAEESGLIHELDDWVFRKACEQIARWQTSDPPSLEFSINISAKQLSNKNFISTIEKVLLETSLPPGLLEVEITETVIMEDLNAALQMLEAIHHLGINVALDDFGTGYSSLSYLSTLPINTLKIDRAFVNTIGKSGQDSAVVNAMVALAHNLNMAIVAEGIETAEQLVFFHERTEGQVQGYYFSKPVSSEQAGLLVQNPHAYKERFFEAVNKGE